MSVSKTTNNGSTWTRYSLAASGYTYALAVDPLNSNIVFAGGNPGLYRTANSGGSWSNITGSITDFVYDIAIDPVSTNIIYVATPDGVFKSTDNGATWAYNGCTGVSSVLVDPDNPSMIYAGTNSGIYKSTSGGGSWIMMNDSLTDNHVTSLGIDPGNYIYCGTEDAGMFRWALDVGIDASHETGIGLKSSAYPTPAHGLVCIRYYLDKQSAVSIKIYDITGREIKIFDNGLQNIGKHETWWHGRDDSGDQVTSGIYYYRLSVNTMNTVGKIILQR